MAPTIALSGDASVDEGSLYSLTLGAVTDPGDDTVTEWTVHWGDGGSDTYLADGVVTHTYADGPADYTISVDLLDEDGTHLAAGSHDVTVDNVKPTISLSGPATADEGDTETYSFVVSDPGLDTHTITVDCGANGAQVGPTAYNPLDGMGSFDCFFADGPATTNVTATVTDSDGAADTDAQLVTVTVANVAPIVSPPTDLTADEGDSVSFDLASFTASDATDRAGTIAWGDGSSDTVFNEAAAGSIGANELQLRRRRHLQRDLHRHRRRRRQRQQTAARLRRHRRQRRDGRQPAIDQTSDDGVSNSFDLGSFTDPVDDSPAAPASTGRRLVGDTRLSMTDGLPGMSMPTTPSPTTPSTASASPCVSDGDLGSRPADTIAVIVANVAPVADAGADQTRRRG